MLPLSMLKLLCPAVQLQQKEQHSVVYNCGEESTHLYLVLSGKLLSVPEVASMHASAVQGNMPGTRFVALTNSRVHMTDITFRVLINLPSLGPILT